MIAIKRKIKCIFFNIFARLLIRPLMNANTDRKRVLVCPLDWGLGHATRCIPIIRELISKGADVIIAGDGHSLELLKQEFPQVSAIRLRGYNIKFSKITISVLLKLIVKLTIKVVSEHREIKKLIRKYKVSIVISDNRYGLWSDEAYSVFITHQPNILPPPAFRFTGRILRCITRWFIRKYDECWIPDAAGEDNLSGKLSHGYHLPDNTRFIGPLSRFDAPFIPDKTETDSQAEITQHHDIVAIISGPEPQRSEFESTIVEKLSGLSLKSLVIRGVTKNHEHQNMVVSGNITITDHLKAEEMYSILKTGPLVICRGGYSTIMDLSSTGNKVICIPTPGQTEQQYLAWKGSSEMKSVMAEQHSFSINDCLSKIHETTGYKTGNYKLRYKGEIERILNQNPELVVNG